MYSVMYIFWVKQISPATLYVKRDIANSSQKKVNIDRVFLKVNTTGPFIKSLTKVSITCLVDALVIPEIEGLSSSSEGFYLMTKHTGD